MPLREFGGVSRRELLKEMWVPATLGTTPMLVGNHPVFRINALNNYAAIELRLPYLSGRVFTCIAQIIGIANMGVMHVDVNIDYGWGGLSHYNAYTSTVTHSLQTSANEFREIRLTELENLILTAMVVGVRLVYNADVGNETNCYICGVHVRWI